MLVIHPEQISFLQKIRSGEKIIWHGGIEWLYCFAEHSPRDDMHLVWQYCYPDFELGYAFNQRTGHFDAIKDTPAAIKFCSFSYRLRDTNTILAARDQDDGIPALAVLADIETWCEARSDQIGEKTISSRSYTWWIRKARLFLEKEKMLIPKEVWMRALQDLSH